MQKPEQLEAAGCCGGMYDTRGGCHALELPVHATVALAVKTLSFPDTLDHVVRAPEVLHVLRAYAVVLECGAYCN